MEIVRNFVNISGLADVNDLPRGFSGQIIQYSETETIFIPDNQPDIKGIFQVMLNIEKKALRNIKTQTGHTLVIDGVRRFKIIYTQNDSSGKANLLDTELPYNTFVEVPETVSIENINIFILDAYFSLLDQRRIYSHILYAVYVSIPSRKPVHTRNPNVNHSKQNDMLKDDLTADEAEIRTKPAGFRNSLDGEPEEEDPGDNQGNVPRDDPDILVDVDAEYL